MDTYTYVSVFINIIYTGSNDKLSSLSDMGRDPAD